MNIMFYYHDGFDINGKPVIFSAYVDDSIEDIKRYSPSLAQIINYLSIDELTIMNNICNEFRSKYNLTIKFHTQYTLEKGINDPKRAFERTKNKVNLLDNRLSFSVSTESASLLVPMYSTDKFIHIPNNLKSYDSKPLNAIKIIQANQLEKIQDEKIFPHKKVLFKELLPLMEELELLNDKLEDYKNKGKPLLIKALFQRANRFAY